MAFKYTLSILCCLLAGISCSFREANPGGKEGIPPDRERAPRVFNIINFVRQTDYRVPEAERLLFETTREQIKLVNKYELPATFLLQYDALIDPRYQTLLKESLNPLSEIGAWWELTQPHVEAAGIRWRGEHSWVSTANVAFSTGYTPQERERLVDVYMEKFKEIFGTYPKSVGSWFIDAHTLSYMHERYHVVASCNCKDQIGTDGYTLWGGYWNQAYYPSKKNAYMPAQTEEGQIPVPIFRMLGSDPVYQYDNGLGNERQGVISLEPVYPESGGDRQWVDYFLESIVNQPCLAFNYAQAGQENSFTWEAMRKGLEMQIPLIDSLRRTSKIRVETLKESGEWFRKRFKVTPTTAVTTLSDIRKEGNKSVWFNSRYYRANLFWDKGSFRFRDIHLFSENQPSAYLDTPGKGNQFLFYALPFVDGFRWSDPDDRAGLRIIGLDGSGSKRLLSLRDPAVTEIGTDTLLISAKEPAIGTFRLTLHEKGIEIKTEGDKPDIRWALELRVAKGKQLPFSAIQEKAIEAEQDGFKYRIICTEGRIEKATEGSGVILRLLPIKDKISLNLTNSNDIDYGNQMAM